MFPRRNAVLNADGKPAVRLSRADHLRLPLLAVTAVDPDLPQSRSVTNYTDLLVSSLERMMSPGSYYRRMLASFVKNTLGRMLMWNLIPGALL